MNLITVYDATAANITHLPPDGDSLPLYESEED